MLGVSADDKHCVTVDGKVVVGRRLHHRAGVVHRGGSGVTHKARAALSGLSGRRHGRWCRIRAPSSGRRSGPSDLFAHVWKSEEAPQGSIFDLRSKVWFKSAID